MTLLNHRQSNHAFGGNVPRRTRALPSVSEAFATRRCLFILGLPSVDLAIARVAERVRQGGHDIPENVIRRRFEAGLRNFEQHYRTAVDAWALYDNAGDEPVLIEWGEAS